MIVMEPWSISTPPDELCSSMMDRFTNQLQASANITLLVAYPSDLDIWYTSTPNLKATAEHLYGAKWSTAFNGSGVHIGTELL